MYLDYWGLTKHPFNNVPNPEMYFDMHQSVDQAVSEVLFAIEEGDEVMAVVVGPAGVGKTMTLRIVLDSLDHAKYRIAFVTNPDMTFPQLLREMVSQLQGRPCEEVQKDRLLELLRGIVSSSCDEGKRVVLFIDEGNVIKPENLESLRLLTNIEERERNPLTIVLAGQPELARRLEDPRRDNLFQRVGVYCRLEGMDSLETTRSYIDYRLERAGLGERLIFTDDAYEAMWAASESGLPRVVNKLCKLCLKAGEMNKLAEINGEVVHNIADRFKRKYRQDGPSATAGSVGKTESLEADGKPAGRRSAGHMPTERLEQPQATIRLGREELEDLANRLANERIKKMGKVEDPFEAWEKIRDGILEQMLKNQE